MAKYRVEKYCSKEECEEFCSKLAELTSTTRSIQKLSELTSDYFEDDDDFFLFVKRSKELGLC
jgi:hypothetical protein